MQAHARKHVQRGAFEGPYAAWGHQPFMISRRWVMGREHSVMLVSLFRSAAEAGLSSVHQHCASCKM